MDEIESSEAPAAPDDEKSPALLAGMGRAIPRRIAWLIHGAELYGAQRAVNSLTLAVRELGWEPVIIALDDGPTLAVCRQHGLSCQVLHVAYNPRLSENRHPLARLQTLWNIQRFQHYLEAPLHAELERIRPLALHILPVNTLAAGGRVARDLGIPCFWEMTNCISSRYLLEMNRWAYRWTCRRNSVVPVGNSHYTAATLGGGAFRARVIHLGADPRIFDPEKVAPHARSELGIPDDAVVLGMVARLDPLKGHERVLEAILGLGPFHPPVHLLVVGGAPAGDPVAVALEASLRRMAAEAGMADRLHIVGDSTEPERWYLTADVIVNAYLEEEAFGLSIIEAMMMRRPVLAHILGGPAETVVDGETGWHAPSASVPALAAGISRALASRSRWPAMGEAGRRRALQLFTTEIQARNYLAMVEQAMKEINQRGRSP